MIDTRKGSRQSTLAQALASRENMLCPRTLQGRGRLRFGVNHRLRVGRPSYAKGRVMGAVVGPGFWDSLWGQREPKFDPNLPFREIFAKYLPRGGDCFEVGCYPGTFLVYLCKNFDYQANGIDTTPFVLTRLPSFLKANGVRVGELIQGNFLQYRSHREYDVVCSFGFLEHFADFQGVIRKHIELLREGGVLVLTCPNFRGLQHVLRAILDPEDLRRHVLPSMDFAAWKRILDAAGMRILYQSYYRTFGFWTSHQSEESASNLRASILGTATAALNNQLNIPNPVTSPLMISISRKEQRPS